MTNVGQRFLQESALFLKDVYLPKIERCVEQLTDENLWWRPNEESNSIGNLILHLSGNVRQWILSGVGEQPDARKRQQEFDQREVIPKKQLLEQLRSTVVEAVDVLTHLNPSFLAESRMIQKKEVSLLYAVYHVVEHFSMHTGQIIAITKLRTGKDLRFYDMKNGIPTEQWHKDKPAL